MVHFFKLKLRRPALTNFTKARTALLDNADLLGGEGVVGIDRFTKVRCTQICDEEITACRESPDQKWIVSIRFAGSVVHVMVTTLAKVEPGRHPTAMIDKRCTTLKGCNRSRLD